VIPIGNAKTNLNTRFKGLDEAVINAMMHRDYSDPTGESFLLAFMPIKLKLSTVANFLNHLKMLI